MATILLVENEPNQRLLYQMDLEDEGHRVLTSSTMEDALNRLTQENPDLVILDLHMNYYHFCEGIQALQIFKECAPGLPVIIYTGLSLYENDFRYWMADAYLTKSSDPAPLNRAVAHVLREPDARDRLD